MEKRNKLDTSLITSDVCIKCQQCCYGHAMVYPKTNFKKKPKIVQDAAEYAEVVFGNAQMHKDGDNITIFTQVRCQNLDDEIGCTIYEDRPYVCRAFNCFDRYNQGDKSWARYFPKLEKILNITLPKDTNIIDVKEIL